MRTELRRTLFTLILESLPPDVRTRLLMDEAFSETFDFAPKFSFSLGSDCRVDMGSLNKALRTAVAGRKSAMLSRDTGAPFRVKLGLHKKGQATIRFKGHNFVFEEADLLSTGLKTRTKALRRALAAHPLTAVEEDSWTKIARERAFTDREHFLLRTALEATPEALYRRLRVPRLLDVGSIMPDEPQYYDRLIAPSVKASDLENFIAGELAESRRQLFKRHRKVALRRIAYTALQQPLIPFDLLSRSLTPSDVQPLLDAKDPFSLLFAFELCCRAVNLADSAFVSVGTAVLARLFDPESSRRRCHVFSALALITVTNLRRAEKLSEAPLFWIRLVALTHAGLLADALGEREDAEQFFHWAEENFYASYRWHSMVDRRDAPRWNSDWIRPDHLHAEIVGRVKNAIWAIAADQRPPDWVSAVEAAFGELIATGDALSAFFPGPFEDFQKPAPAAVVPELFKGINDKLEEAADFSDVPDLFAFAYSVPLPEPALTAVLNILSRPLDEPVTNDGQDLPFLHLAAHIAGTARSEAISAAVVNRCLYTASKTQSDKDFPTLFAIAVEACGAYQNPAKYREMLGATTAQLCGAVEDSEYISQLEPILDVLGMRDEKLIPALARARAIMRIRTSA
jgi:hypothetical protein